MTRKCAVCQRQQIVRGFVSCALGVEDPAVQVDVAVAVYSTATSVAGSDA